MRLLLFLLLIAGSFQILLAQNSRTISGKVLDENGNPVANASVIVKNKNTGVTTSQDGSFSISVDEKAKTLVLSFIDMQTVEVAITRENLGTIVLKASDKSLSEVVVTGYGTQRRKEVTGSISKVKGDALTNKPVQSFDQALGGRAAGVQVTIPQSVLNSPPVIRIRGTNSISLSSFPLVVLDGVPIFTGDASGTNSAANALGAINPNDIESIDVAKDAAAAAIYGSRAAGGVLFINTKKGKQGKARITYDGWAGMSTPMRLPKLLDAFQFVDYKNEALSNSGILVPGTTQFRLTNGPNGQPINTNWFDVVYRNAIQSSHAVSISGANDATNYFFSASYTNQQGIIRKNDFKRLTVLFNIDQRISKILSIGSKIQYAKDDNLAAGSTGSNPGEAFTTAGVGRIAVVNAPNVAPFNNDGSYNVLGSTIGNMNNIGNGVQSGFANPQVMLDLNRSNNFNNRILGNFYVQLKPVKGLLLKSLFGVDYLYSDDEIFQHPVSFDGFADNGVANSVFSKNERTVFTNTAQYDFAISGKHNFSLLAGNEQQSGKFQRYGLTRTNISDADFDNIAAGWVIPNVGGVGFGRNYLLSNFGRLQYNFDKKYFISANVRNDGASQLGLNSKFGTFWGISAGWEISKENFWTQSGLGKTIDFLKLRASHGKVGNIGGLANFASLNTYGSGLYGQSPTFVFNQAGNPDLTWETSVKTDVGLEYSILNNKLSGEIGWYNNDVSGLLLFVPQPLSAGLPNALPENVGKMYNRGFEFSISAPVISKKDFSWNTSFNITYNKNEVTQLASLLPRIITATSTLESPSVTLAGFPLAMIFVTKTAGVDPATGRRIFINGQGQEVLYQHVAPAGQFRWSFRDGTQAPPVSAADAVPYANTQPKFFGGFENTLRFKNFELNALLVYQFGAYLYFGTRAGLLDQRFWNNSTEVLNRWSKPGDATDIPKPYYGDNISNGSAFPLDINVFKSDFIKLRTLTMSYNLSKNIAQKIGIASARLYVTGNNLFIITPYPGSDPEVSSNGNGNTNFGVDRNTVVGQRGLIIGVNIGF
jgi:TonB-dependent starch-binding outer membrane protein SusC